jgi:outer membrane protein assembly complex protein YaeT
VVAATLILTVRNYAITLALVCVWFASASAFPIRRIIFQGNAQIASVKLQDVITSGDDNPLKRDYGNRPELLLAVQRIEERINSYYASEGYLYASVDSFQISLFVPADSSQGYLLTFFLHEGTSYRVGSITIIGSRVFSESDLISKMSTSLGKVLKESTLKTDIDELLKLYESHGYPLAKIHIVRITPSVDSLREGSLTIVLQVEEGPRARIGNIVVTGNETTDPSIVIRELRLSGGTYFNAEALGAARARVERLGFFESVSEPELFLNRDSTVTIVLRVKEASTSTIDGVLGYNPPRSSTESGYISGLVDLSFRNISGSGRNASLRYDHSTQESQTLEIHYLEPWLFGYPVNVQLGFLQRQQDTIYTRTTATGDLSLMISQDISILGNLALERVIPSNQDSALFSAWDSRTLTTGLSARVDTRDNSIAPRYGVLGLLGASYGVKSIYGPARFVDSSTPISIGLRTVALDASGFHTLFSSRVVGAIGLHARSVSATGGVLDASDLFRLGGLFSIRGYREEELLASRYAYTNLELRLMTSRVSFFDVFFDAGYLMKDSTKTSPLEQVQYPLSYGIGAQVDSPLGIIAVSIGLAKGEPIDQAKFHFGLIKQF